MSGRNDETYDQFDFDEEFSINSVHLDEFRRRKARSTSNSSSEADNGSSSYRQSNDFAVETTEHRLNSEKTFPSLQDGSSENLSFSVDGEDYGVIPGSPSMDNPSGSVRKILAVLLFLILGIGAVVIIKYIIEADKINSVSQFDYPEPVTVSDVYISSSDISTDNTVTQGTTTAMTRDTTEYQTLRLGDNNQEVKKMQIRLKELGYIDSSSCTGYYGDFTKKIIKRFQKKAGLKVTGIADPETLKILYSDKAPVCYQLLSCNL